MTIRILHYYDIPFYREYFLIDSTFTSLLVVGASSIFVMGGLIGGRLVNWFGRKPLTVLGAVLTGVLTIAYINVPSLWLSLSLLYLGTFMVTMRNAAYTSLVLEQVPAYRGTMMSISQFSQNIGGAIGNGLGGLILVAFDYGHMGVVGLTAVIAAVIFYVFTIDPTQQVKQ
jgi:predicted MFS family arabinose efflux permease